MLLVVVPVVMFVATVVAFPIILRRLPEDYFVRGPTKRSPLAHVVRNVVGVILIVLGVAMLVLPGQGVLTIIVGLSVVDLPFKHRLMQRLLGRPSVQRTLQALRLKLGAPPLVLPGPAEG